MGADAPRPAGGRKGPWKRLPPAGQCRYFSSIGQECRISQAAAAPHPPPRGPSAAPPPARHHPDTKRTFCDAAMCIASGPDAPDATRDSGEVPGTRCPAAAARVSVTRSAAEADNEGFVNGREHLRSLLKLSHPMTSLRNVTNPGRDERRSPPMRAEASGRSDQSRAGMQIRNVPRQELNVN